MSGHAKKIGAIGWGSASSGELNIRVRMTISAHGTAFRSRPFPHLLDARHRIDRFVPFRVIVVAESLGGSSDGSENILSGRWSNFCLGSAAPSLADLHGLANRDRKLGSADVGELDRPRCRGKLKLLRPASRHAQLERRQRLNLVDCSREILSWMGSRSARKMTPARFSDPN